jgi:hypothetical protein
MRNAKFQVVIPPERREAFLRDGVVEFPPDEIERAHGALHADTSSQYRPPAPSSAANTVSMSDAIGVAVRAALAAAGVVAAHDTPASVPGVRALVDAEMGNSAAVGAAARWDGRIEQIVRERKCSYADAGAILCREQPDLYNLRREDLAGMALPAIRQGNNRHLKME